MDYKELFSSVFSTFDIISNEHTKTLDWIRLLENEEYELNDHADHILQKIGGLKIKGREKNAGRMLVFYFNPVYYTSNDYYCVSEFNEAVNDILFPIGGVSDFTIFVGKKGKYYIASWKEVIECGESFQSFIENITSNKPILKEVYRNPMYPFEFYFESLLSGFEVLSIEHEKVNNWVKLLVDEGYEINDNAKRILHQVGGLRFKGIGKDKRLLEMSFEPIYYASGDYELNMCDYLRGANDSLFPIGFWYDYSIFVGKKGKYYLARPFDMYECGNTFSEFIINVFAGKEHLKPIAI